MGYFLEMELAVGACEGGSHGAPVITHSPDRKDRAFTKRTRGGESLSKMPSELRSGESSRTGSSRAEWVFSSSYSLRLCGRVRTDNQGTTFAEICSRPRILLTGEAVM